MARIIKSNLSNINYKLPKFNINYNKSPIRNIIDAVNNSNIDFKKVDFDEFVKQFEKIEDYVTQGKNISIFDYTLEDDSSSTGAVKSNIAERLRGGGDSLPADWQSPYPYNYMNNKNTVANQREVYSYLKNMGLNDAAVAGVMANIEAESAYNTSSSAMDTNGYRSNGLFCWNERYTAAWVYGTTVNSQMNYMAKTIKPSTLQKLQNVPNTAAGAQQAAIIFASEYEVCTKADYGRRQGFASAYYRSF